MAENKRYYSRDYDEEFYIFDSQILTEKEFDEKNEFEDYSLFADSLTQQEVVDLLNENEQLKKENEELEKENNELKQENEQLKQELQKIYEIATINKVRDIVENVYDDLLYETSNKSDYARTNVLKCLEDIDNLRDDLE